MIGFFTRRHTPGRPDRDTLKGTGLSLAKVYPPDESADEAFRRLLAKLDDLPGVNDPKH